MIILFDVFDNNDEDNYYYLRKGKLLNTFDNDNNDEDYNQIILLSKYL